MDVVAVQREVSPLERRIVNVLVPLTFSTSRRGGPWSPPAGFACREVRIPSTNGVTLAGLWLPHEAPKGVVVLAHPDRRYGRHWFVREGWIGFLHAHGLEVLLFDFPGYGASTGPGTFHHEHVVSAARFAHAWAGGLPVHVVGLSLGAFAAANASPHLPFVHGLALESPYPTFNAWYGRGAGKLAMDAFDTLFPRVTATIQADKNIARAHARRILVTLAEEDEVTAPRLTEALYAAAPADRARLLRVPGARHLEPFTKSEAYRAALLETFGLAPQPTGARREASGETTIAAPPFA